MAIPSTDLVQDLTITCLLTPLPIHFQLDLNTNTERVNSLILDYVQTVQDIKGV